MSAAKVTRLGQGAFAVEIDGRREIVYAARTAAGRVAFCEGEVFKEGPAKAGHYASPAKGGRHARGSGGPALPIAAPMPATVMKVMVEAGASVRKGDTLVILEAMKMELPLRASADGMVTAVHCHAGQLVQPDTVLIELA